MRDEARNAGKAPVEILLPVHKKHVSVSYLSYIYSYTEKKSIHTIKANTTQSARTAQYIRLSISVTNCEGLRIKQDTQQFIIIRSRATALISASCHRIRTGFLIAKQEALTDE